jgi:hypothetical protein
MNPTVRPPGYAGTFVVGRVRVSGVDEITTPGSRNEAVIQRDLEGGTTSSMPLESTGHRCRVQYDTRHITRSVAGSGRLRRPPS